MQTTRKTIPTLPYLDDFLLNLQTNNYSDETIYNYERDLEVFNNFLKEINFNFDDVNKKAILNYKAYLTSKDRKTAKSTTPTKKLASFSINRMLSALRAYLNYLIDMDYEVPVSPQVIKFIKTEKKYPRVSEFDEVIKLIESPTMFEKDKTISMRNRAALETLFSTGMRISELINLQMNQIDKKW